MEKNIIHSKNPLENTSFPFLALNVKNEDCFPDNLGFRKVHWHEELQFIYVLDGIIEIKIVDKTIRLKKNQAIFINKALLHETVEIENCHYRSFIFNEKFLSFYPGSFMEKNNVNSITNNLNLYFIIFKSKDNWENEVLKKLKDLNELEINKKNEVNYEYKISMQLINIWFLIISNINEKNIVLFPKENIKYKRVKKFLDFIRCNYEKDISLDEIAKSANVSKSECIRCFKVILDITPYRYLLEYRLNKSLELLKNTNYSITEIGSFVGFNHSSHYIKYFKRYLNMTPLEYREKNLVEIEN